jgi:hypothetical protein
LVDCSGPFTSEFTPEFDNRRRWYSLDAFDCGGTPEANYWVTRRDVYEAMGSLPLTDDDDAWLQTCVRAANAMIRRFRPDLPLPERGLVEPGPDGKPRPENPKCLDPAIHYGAVQLCIEMYRRKGAMGGESPAGFSEFGPPPSSLSYEAQLFLGIGYHHAPVVA